MSEGKHRVSRLNMQLLRIVSVQSDGRLPPVIDGPCEIPFGGGRGRAASSFEQGTL